MFFVIVHVLDVHSVTVILILMIIDCKSLPEGKVSIRERGRISKEGISMDKTMPQMTQDEKQITQNKRTKTHTRKNNQYTKPTKS